jgi:hypothetical protein
MSKERFIPPTIEDCLSFFTDEGHPDYAIEFWEHFENCDWRLSSGRGAKMKSWRLSAKKWIRDAWKFGPRGERPAPPQGPRFTPNYDPE